MMQFFLLSLPAFATIAIGWAAARTGFLQPTEIDVLGRYAFRIALPPLVFELVTKQAIDIPLYGGVFMAYLVCSGLVFSLVMAVCYFLDSQRRGRAAAFATAATVGNAGYLGPPLLLAYCGPRAAMSLVVAIAAEVMILLSLGGVIMGHSTPGRAGIRGPLLRGTVYNPVVLAAMLGLIVASCGTIIPIQVDRWLGLLGGSAGPTALFALGGTLAFHRFDKRGLGMVGLITSAKLVIYPLLVWYVFARLLRPDALLIQGGVLVAALPPASSAYLLSQRFGIESEKIAGAIVLATFLSALTVPVTAWLAFGTSPTHDLSAALTGLPH
jgi:predicted permease